VNLLAALVLLLFSNGRWVIPLAAWVSPIFLLRFARGGRAWPRLLGIAAALYATACLTWWGMVPVPPPFYFLIMLMITLPGVLPYLVDRALVRRGDPLVSTLVFGAAWVVTEYLNSLLSPYGSWGAVAYTQVDHLPLLQTTALTGLWGIGFLIAWSAAVVNWTWERGFEWPNVRRGVLAWSGTLALVLLLGGARMALAPPASPSLRVAAISLEWPAALSPDRLLSERTTGAALDTLRARLAAHEQVLYAAVRREAAAGAALVVWSEVGAFVLKSDQAAFEERAAAVARETGAYLVAGVAVFTPGEGYYENLWFGFDPQGRMIGRYHKARPVPGDPERGADKEIPVVATALGNLAGAVCFDADFPNLMRKAGRRHADLLVVPASDWRAIDPVHTRMALVRGVENGCSVIRATRKGLSAAADYQGRILAATDFFRATPSVMVTQVPSRGVRTPYARLPNLLPSLCVGVLAAAVVGRMVSRTTSGGAQP
jgi:apolipoprotein N-acyltransferase